MSEPIANTAVTDISVREDSALKLWIESGAPWVWMTAGAVSICIILVVGLLGLIATRGLAHFWPAEVVVAQYQMPGGEAVTWMGEIRGSESVATARLQSAGLPVSDDQAFYDRLLFKRGNRDQYGSDFVYVMSDWLVDRQKPENVMVFERTEWGNFYGTLAALIRQGERVATGDSAREPFLEAFERARSIHKKIERIEKSDIGVINFGLERLRLEQRRLQLNDELTDEKLVDIESKRRVLEEQYRGYEDQLTKLYGEIGRDSVIMQMADGAEITLPLAKIVRVYQPNAMNAFEKVVHYFAKIGEFVSDEPREANTEGGIFPAIFGTVMMVLLMAVLVTPFGVVAALYLREYARQGIVTRVIRIAVNNLAGVPSIVYGVFGLGFFVYFLGGNIDQLFYPEALPAPTFGTPGILWASLTLAILTLPVVIVATEEGLSRIPRSLREASLALGATKAETLWRVVLPMASPAMMTGLILAVARAAGEVAPLMLVGVVKLAPSLPMDGNFPFLHLERKFMHLGFHIYDVGFQSPNVEAARPLVYATALLLVVVIIVLNLAAVRIRNRLREKYRALEH